MNIQHRVLPEAGKDYPHNWNEFLDWFGSEEACQAYL
ncbi:MAG: IS1595 family transposase, partial [Burkholderiales bacterium]|nr:IS1595 family transposase [Burkholderiales bacterium]